MKEDEKHVTIKDPDATTIKDPNANRVVIWIWSGLSKTTRSMTKGEEGSANNSQPNVGHISIQTPNRYMSLWPTPYDPRHHTPSTSSGLFKGTPLSCVLRNTDKRTPDFKKSYEADYKAEGNEDATYCICLYSLKWKAMEDSYDAMVAHGSVVKWRLIPDPLDGAKKMIGFSKEEALSCADFAYKLLQGGGINDRLLPNKPERSSVELSLNSPAQMEPLSFKAKLTEQRLYPETSEFHYVDESDIPAKFYKQNIDFDDAGKVLGVRCILS